MSRERGLREGWWRHDPGDPVDVASDPLYGVDGEGPLPPSDEIRQERSGEGVDDVDGEDFVDEKMELVDRAARLLEGKIDLAEDDMNWGINVFTRAVLLLSAIDEENGGLFSEPSRSE